MAMPIIAVPQFPDVPNVPGVPSLNRMVGSVLEPRFAGIGGLPIALGIEIADRFGTNGLIGQDNPNLPAPRPAEVWGLFTAGGQPVVIADSVLSVEFRNETHISNYPQEAGAFAAYNKVATPYRVRIRLSKGGTVEDRRSFLSALEAVANASNVALYSVVTPERTYDSANVTGIDYMREQRSGAAMLIVELIVEEIRVTALAIYTNTQQPTGENSISIANVQAIPTLPNQVLPAAPNTPGSQFIPNAFHH